MQITCLGAAHCVTGSCFLLDNGHKYLIDCGMFQGGRQMEALNYAEWGFNPREITAIFLTHAHIDHCGRIPKLFKDGFRGKIYATRPTIELAKILLLDSAHIQAMEAEWQTRKNRRQGTRDIAPLYDVDDVNACFPRFKSVQQDKTINIAPDLKVRFRNAGHILGSAILEMWCGPESNSRKIVFSGDLGHKDQLIVQDPCPIAEADTLFIESTYGNRNHKSMEDSRRELVEAIHYSYNHGEKVVIPAFAVERTQELLLLLGEFFRKQMIPSMPVYLDSPLAIAATDIFRRMPEFYDEETNQNLQEGEDPFSFPQLILSHNYRDSMAINQTPGPAIVIAGNGMCTAGRIKHHLKHNLWRNGSSVVIVGFQAAGSPGRRLVEGAGSLKILGENVIVRARIFTIGGFSAHADQSGLLDWLSGFTNPDLRVHVIHGEQKVSEEFAGIVKARFGFQTDVPDLDDVIPVIPETVREKLLGAAEGPAEIWERIRTLWDRLPESLSPELLNRLEGELARTESRLEAILQEAKTPVAAK
ncbi:MAG: MBL fold metallo-hydrolase [Desulfobacteraceae bacterium]|nr:MBL fold metallo-hydrolase [Desulfobacteraceae bacterium]